MNVKHTSEIADKLEELAAAIRDMDESVPGKYGSLKVEITMHRHEGDGSTNGEAMAFVDRYAKAVGIPADEISANGNYYGTSGVHGMQVTLFPLESKPKRSKFDPNL
jgi:hypothetical protein